MKKHISILVLILSFVVFQGSASKTETNNQEIANAQWVKNTNAEAASKEREEKAERRSHAVIRINNRYFFW